MKLTEIIHRLKPGVLCGDSYLDREISGGYVSDILSDVLTHAREGNIWVTRRVHLNIIPIASARDIAAIIIVKNRKPDAETLEKGESEKIPILVTQMNAFEVTGKLYQMGIRGNAEKV